MSSTGKKVFVPRTSTPMGTDDEKYYKNNPYGRSGSSLLGDGHYGMPNCTCYAWGRFYELMAKNGMSGTPKLSTGNAKDWYGNTSDGYERSKDNPTVGAVCCWWRDDEPTRTRGGHVAIVEAIEEKDDGTLKIITSDSAYQGTEFYMSEREGSNWGQGSAYRFQGFIHHPVEFKNNNTADPPTDTETYIWNFLYAYFRNAYAVAGIMGNLKAESELIPYNLENTGNSAYGLTDQQFTARLDNGNISKSTFVNDGRGYGLAQWTYDEFKQSFYEFKSQFCSFFREYDPNTNKKREQKLDYDETIKSNFSFGDLEFQLNFLVRWLYQGNKTKANGVLNTNPSEWWKTLKESKSYSEASDYFCDYIEDPEVNNFQTRSSYASAFYTKYKETTKPDDDFDDKYGVYDWMCGGTTIDFDINSQYEEPSCEKCDLKISKCLCYFLKPDIIPIIQYIQPYENPNSMNNPKGIILHFVNSSINKFLYKIPNIDVPSDLKPELQEPLSVPYHYIIGTYKIDEKIYTTTINTYSPKKSLPILGNGKFGTCDKDFIHILICDDREKNYDEKTPLQAETKYDIMSVIRTLVYYKLLADETIPTATDTTGPNDYDNFYLIKDPLLKEIATSVAWIFKNYIFKNSDNKPSYKSIGTVKVGNREDVLPVLLSMNEIQMYGLTNNLNSKYLIPWNFCTDEIDTFHKNGSNYPDKIIKKNISKEEDWVPVLTTYCKYDYNQFYSEPLLYSASELNNYETPNKKQGTYIVYNIYNQIVDSNNMSNTTNPQISNSIIIKNADEAVWADGEEIKLETSNNDEIVPISLNKLYSVTTDPNDGYFILEQKTKSPQYSFIKGNVEVNGK